ncbi:hypothetical protein HYP93_gp89 [Stenotrophomonas phage Pokken]|uniref:Uncharacterized protein n=1 Tax=Stenotrophomonas phage Pokken TaxID=2596674 RepID=A0A5B9N599_9CAUD|nr:hypothetical protein HYP93_gp89 [Stenotrophomonas phage Pokken]QEG09268.1 hypothetical protein CPT_Pokken_050 [Stenotrophomonas phage Pokken]
MSNSPSTSAGDAWAKAHYQHDLKPEDKPASVIDVLIKTQFYCCECHGTNLVSDGPCVWDFDKQEWVRNGEVYDDTFCSDCEHDVKVYTKEVVVGL